MWSRRVLAVVLCLACAGVAWGKPGRLTEKKAKKLLPEAASIDPHMLSMAISLGTRVGPRDLEGSPSLPLLALVLSRPQAWPPSSGCGFELAPGVDALGMAKALGGGALPWEGGKPATLLRPEYVRSITVEQEGDVAKGVVTFEAKGAYAGTVHYEATRGKRKWAITAFTFPERGARIVHREGKWHVDKMPHVAPLLELAHIHHTDETLPPEGHAAVHLLESGDIVAGKYTWPLATGSPDEQVESLEALEKWLGERVAAAETESDGRSRLNVVVVAASQTRWQYVTWILQKCASSRIQRTFFAARSAETGAVGAAAAFLPADGLAPSTEEIPGRSREVPQEEGVITIRLFRENMYEDGAARFTRVKIGNAHTFDLPKGWKGRAEDGRRKEYDQVIAQIREAVSAKAKEARAEGSELSGKIATPMPFGSKVPHEDAMQMIGVLLDAGIEQIVFEGSPLPERWNVPR